MGIIYKATNTLENKVYIGQTKRDFEKRVQEHIKTAKKNKNSFYLYNAMNKYGYENFKWEIILICEDKDMNFYEKKFINYYNSFEKGYNLTTGGGQFYIISSHTRSLLSNKAKEKIGEKNPFYGKGDLVRGEKNHFYGKKHTQETIEKMRNIRLGTKRSEEAKKKTSESLLGSKNPFYGRKHSKETIEKMRLVKLGKKHTEDSKTKMSESRTGSKNHFYGKHHTEETKIKIIEGIKNWNIRKNKEDSRNDP